MLLAVCCFLFVAVCSLRVERCVLSVGAFCCLLSFVFIVCCVLCLLFLVVCSLCLVGCCLYVCSRWVLFVACCVLFGLCCVLFVVVCLLLFVVGCLPFVVCCSLFVMCCLLCVRLMRFVWLPIDVIYLSSFVWCLTIVVCGWLRVVVNNVFACVVLVCVVCLLLVVS